MSRVTIKCKSCNAEFSKPVTSRHTRCNTCRHNKTGNTSVDCGAGIRDESTRCVVHAHRGQRYRFTRTDGYVYVYSPDHPKVMAKKAKYVLEHVLIMENILGRYLYPKENIRHKNGVRNDNRPENLELWVTSQPSGQRPEDLLRWAKEIISRYETL